MEQSTPPLAAPEQLTLGELKDQAFDIKRQFHRGEHGPELVEAARMVLSHSSAPSLPNHILRGLNQLVGGAVPVEMVRSCRQAPPPKAFPILIQQDKTHRNAVSRIPAGLREKAAEKSPICAPHVPGFRPSSFWDQTDRTPANRVAKWVDGTAVHKDWRAK
ncbi:MAG: hypothetical protein AAB383_03590 [Patescibacteria group bacterium]